MCSAGTYQNETGSTSCLPCAAGQVSSKMKDRCSACGVGTWSDGTGGQCVTCTGPTDCRCMADPLPCGENVPCYNLANDGTSYMCGECPPGYRGDGINCVDIDEVCSSLTDMYTFVRFLASFFRWYLHFMTDVFQAVSMTCIFLILVYRVQPLLEWNKLL